MGACEAGPAHPRGHGRPAARLPPACSRWPRSRPPPSPRSGWPSWPASTPPRCARTSPTWAPTAPGASATTSSTCCSRSAASSASPRTGRSSSSASATWATPWPTTAGFAARGFRVVALVDADPAKVGERVGDLEVRHMDDLPEVVQRARTSPSASSPPPPRWPRRSPTAWSRPGVTVGAQLRPVGDHRARRTCRCARSTWPSSCRSSASTSSGPRWPDGRRAPGRGRPRWSPPPSRVLERTEADRPTARRRLAQWPRSTCPSSPAYPVNLRLDGQPCLVVGGGAVAARKAAGPARLRGRRHGRRPRGRRPRSAPSASRSSERPYRPGDVAGYRLVIAATGDRAVDRAVFDDGEAAGVWVNSADDPASLPLHPARGRPAGPDPGHRVHRRAQPGPGHLAADPRRGRAGPGIRGAARPAVGGPG